MLFDWRAKRLKPDFVPRVRTSRVCPAAAPKPDAVFDRDGQSVLQARASYLSFNGRGRHVDVDPGGNLHFIANRDAIAIEEDTVIVYERAVADGDVIAIVAPEGRFDYRSLTNSAEQLRQQQVPFRVGLRSGRVELC